MRLNLLSDRRSRPLTRRRVRFFQQLERRTLLAAGTIELGPSDNIALDQPRVAIELATDVDPGPGVQWESLGPSLFNTFLLDTGASSMLAMATAVADMQTSNIGYTVQGSLLETGVAGDHLLDVSVPYRFDFAGSDGIRHTLTDARIMSDASNDFSSLGPWGLAGMPAMVNRVTSLDFSGWSGGGLGLDDIYMDTEFRNDVPPDDGHRYTISLDNRISFDPLDQMITGQPPVWGDVPFVTASPEHNGVAQEGNFLFDTGAQISVISKQLAIDIGLDTNGDGELNQADTNYVTNQVVGGVGGQIGVPVFGFDEFHLPTDSGEDLVWTNLEWLVLDITTPGAATTLDGVFGSDLLTSGWFHAFFNPGQPDGYINQMHMDFRDMETDGTAKVHFDLNPDVDNVIPPGPGIIVRQSFRTTDVGEGGATDTYNIALTAAPTADVTITLENTDGQLIVENDDDGSNTLVFTPQNWQSVQTVLVTADNDLAAEGNHTALITHTVSSADLGYDNREVPDVTVRIIDDDLNLLEITSDQAGLNPISSIDALEGGDTVHYWVALTEQPAYQTWVQFEEAREPGTVAQTTAQRTVNPDPLFGNVLEFNAGNWSTPQQVAVNAIHDTIQEGPHQAKLVHTVIDISELFVSEVVGATTLNVDITDADQGEVIITPGSGLAVSESGATDTYQVSLNMVPSGAVQVTVTAEAETLLSADDGLSFASTQVLSFTDMTLQTIIVQAIDDDVAEQTHSALITHAVTGTVNDAKFPTSIAVDSILATISDNDTAGMTITSQAAGFSARSATGSAPATSVDLFEAGGDVLYWIQLDSQPTDDVTLFLNNADQQVEAVDANNPAVAILTFNSLNWNTPQAVQTWAAVDTVVEGVHASQISHNMFSADSNYQGSVVIPVSITDDDTADFGDAPAPYPTTVIDGGAHHAVTGPRLGANRDGEIEGVPSTDAEGDDSNGPVNDEDGVQFGGIHVNASMAGLNILLENAGSAKVDAWIDFDRDGVWATTEQILDSQIVSNSIQTLNYSLPAGVTTGGTFARVRLSTAGNLDPTGWAPDGEVEDYFVNIVSAPMVESIAINHGDPQRSSVEAVTVNFDRIVEIDDLGGDPFVFVNTDSGQIVTDLPNVFEDDGKTIVDFTFAAGPSVENGSLMDGNYSLSVDASLVSYFGVSLDGDGDGAVGDPHLFGDSAVDAFFRNYGDSNGTGVVDLLDFAAFRGVFGKSVGDPGYAAGLDSDGDNTIGLLDFAAFRGNFGS